MEGGEQCGASASPLLVRRLFFFAGSRALGAPLEGRPQDYLLYLYHARTRRAGRRSRRPPARHTWVCESKISWLARSAGLLGNTPGRHTALYRTRTHMA